MDALIDWLLAFMADRNDPLALAILASSAALEYVVPPFPGDTITLFGAVLITAYDWSFPAVFGAVMLGSAIGAMAAYYIGGWLQGRRRRERAIIDRLIAGFRRHGAVYLILNRFLPGARVFFFVAAGMAGMRPMPVMVYSLISAALWNLGLIAIGSALGANFDTLLGWVRRYTAVVGLLALAIGLVIVVRILLRRRAGADGSSGSSPR